ncbi:MAG: RluA family pseudouridine synthase [Candidatus Riflebacteria bacterium]|nr:RluA family pseudouridine synthase [Candidatus Riflebacteria bacterium]
MIYDLELKSPITEQFSGQSVIDYLTDRFTYKTREQWLELINSGAISINGEKVSKNYTLKAGIELCYTVHNYSEPDLDCNYHKIYVNENIIVVSKPANLPISSNHRFFKQNMTALLRENEKLSDINPIHRIDRETSGLLIYLKKRFDNPVSLRKDPRLIMADKYYLAVVRGEISKKSFSINVPLIVTNTQLIGYKVEAASQGTGKEASTDFYNLGTVKGFTLLLAKLNSGRKHQIRAHCSLAGFPIVGDKLYSFDSKYQLKKHNNEVFTEKDYQELGARYHLLHSFVLNLNLPKEGHKQVVSEYFSEDFKEYLKLFGEQALEEARQITSTDGTGVLRGAPYS